MVLIRNDNGSDGTPVYYDTRIEKDILGRKRKVTDARGLTTDYKPPLNPPQREGSGETEPIFSFVENPDSGKNRMLPDVAGKPAFSWDRRGFRQRMEYDAAQRPVEKWVKNPVLGYEILKEKMVYGLTAPNPRTKNLRGLVFEQYDQAGKATNVDFDFKGNPKEEQRQFAQVFDAELDYSGNVPLHAEIFTTQYSYDALDRPTQKTSPDSSICKYNYAKNALLQSETVDVRNSSTDQNAINDIKYNAKGQRTAIYYANGSKTRYTYDPDTFRVERILTTRNNGADILQDLNYTYDAAGNITEMKDDAQQTIYFANQVVPPLCKYTYDSLYRLKKATGRELNGLNQPSATDPPDGRAGCPIQTPVPDTETSACRNYTLNYEYDELGNILQIQHIAQNGNWTRDYYYPTDNNRLIGHEDGQTDYTYDEAGNMLTMPHLNEMIWNEDNMLIEADLGGGGTAYYRYDSQGQRVRKVIVNGNVKKERLYIGDFELWQQSTNGTIETERETLNISDPSTSSGQVKSFLQLETLTVENGNNISTPTTIWRYQHDNHLGSACLELDDSAAVISYEEYFPFGATSYRSGKSQSEVKLKRYRYCGKERDEETGLYYYGARFYAGWLGRFISVDPLAEKYRGWNPYNYVLNNPVRLVDADGMKIGDGIELFNKFRSAVNNKTSSLQNAIAKRTNRVQKRIDKALAKGKKNKANRLQTRLNTRNAVDQEKLSELSTINKELNTLESSDQVYNIVTDSTPKGAGGATTYDTATGNVNVNLGVGYSTARAAHELKHAFQFDSGALSFDSSGQRGGALYDLVDEFEAYSRSSLFGYKVEVSSLSDVAKLYPSISKRNSQLTLNTKSAKFQNAASLGKQLRSRTRIEGSAGSSPSQYYHNWKNSYMQGAFNNFLKKL